MGRDGNYRKNHDNCQGPRKRASGPFRSPASRREGLHFPRRRSTDGGSADTLAGASVGSRRSLGKEVVATATHYEILGVRPDASHDDVKRAFTALALRWHPDRQADTGPDARERAEWRMAEINAAWDVLRSPAARAAYDDVLAGRGPAAGPSAPPPDAPAERPAPGPTGTRPGARPPSFADQLVDPTRVDPVPRRSGGRRWAPSIVLAVLLIAVVAWASVASHKPSAPPTTGVELQTGSFLVGSCVAVTPGPEAVTVPCSQPNSGRVAATTDYPRPCPPDTDAVSLPSRQLSLCLVPT